MTRVFIVLTVLLQFLAFQSTSANEAEAVDNQLASWESSLGKALINLPNGLYKSANKSMSITKNKAKIEVSKSEIIDLELQRGIGPTMPGDYIYIDKDKNNPQVIIGNCKKLNKITCFFEVTEPEKASDGNQLDGRFLVYEIEIVNNGALLSVNIEKYRESDLSERTHLKSIREDFYQDVEQQQDNINPKSLR